MKTLIVTSENKAKNTHILGNKNVGDILTFTEHNFPKVWNNANVNYNCNLPEFLNTIKPILSENQQIDYDLNNGVIDVENGTFTYGIIEVPEPTAQQLYDELIEQGKIVFDEFRTSLAKASVNYLLKGDVPQALKDLVVELETTKSNINQVLQLYLNYNNVAKLKAFRFNTPEAEEFKNRIENFK